MRLAMIQMSNSGSVEKNMEKVCMRLQKQQKREQSLCCSRKCSLRNFFRNIWEGM